MNLLFLLFAADLVNANQLYNQGEYDQALEMYLQTELTNADQFFNLANIYYRKNDFGRAVFYYMKARRLAPRDPDIKYNLDYTLKSLETAPLTYNTKDYLSLSFLLNNKEKLIIFIASSLVFWIFLACFIFFKKIHFKYLTITFLLLSLLFLIPNIFTLTKNDKFGIVITDKAPVYSGTGKDNVLLFTLPLISYVTVISKSDDWIQMAHGNNRGWIQSSDIISDDINNLIDHL